MRKEKTCVRGGVSACASTMEQRAWRRLSRGESNRLISTCALLHLEPPPPEKNEYSTAVRRNTLVRTATTPKRNTDISGSGARPHSSCSLDPPPPQLLPACLPVPHLLYRGVPHRLPAPRQLHRASRLLFRPATAATPSGRRVRGRRRNSRTQGLDLQGPEVFTGLHHVKR